MQVVVLSRIIPDQEQAMSSAAGIKLLVDLLQDSQSVSIRALACDCIARLAHTRAGTTHRLRHIINELLLKIARGVFQEFPLHSFQSMLSTCFAT